MIDQYMYTWSDNNIHKDRSRPLYRLCLQNIFHQIEKQQPKPKAFKVDEAQNVSSSRGLCSELKLERSL